jgi:hypothetical protein
MFLVSFHLALTFVTFRYFVCFFFGIRGEESEETTTTKKVASAVVSERKLSQDLQIFYLYIRFTEKRNITLLFFLCLCFLSLNQPFFLLFLHTQTPHNISPSPPCISVVKWKWKKSEWENEKKA